MGSRVKHYRHLVNGGAVAAVLPVGQTDWVWRMRVPWVGQQVDVSLDRHEKVEQFAYALGVKIDADCPKEFEFCRCGA